MISARKIRLTRKKLRSKSWVQNRIWLLEGDIDRLKDECRAYHHYDEETYRYVFKMCVPRIRRNVKRLMFLRSLIQ